MADPYNLRRFVDAQYPVIDQVFEELVAGKKRGHWMWFIFPQIQGLGRSPMAREFSIKSKAEAVAFSDHAILGPRLRECTSLVITAERPSIEQIFDYPDYLKFHSSMTLFMACIAGRSAGCCPCSAGPSGWAHRPDLVEVARSYPRSHRSSRSGPLLCGSSCSPPISD